MTSLPINARGLRHLSSAARAGLDWWLGELAALLPRHLSGRDVSGLVVTVAADGQTLACHGPDGAPVDTRQRRTPAQATLRLPDDLALARTVTLAAAAEENLSEVVGFQLDRFTPFEPGDVYLGCRIVGRDPDAEAVTVALAVAPRDDVDRLVARALQQGLACHTVVVAAQIRQAGLAEDLPLELAAAEAAPGRTGRATRALWALSALLACACVAVPLLRGQAAVRQLQQDVAALRREAQAVTTLRSEVEERTEQAALPLQRAQRIPLSTLLAEVTRLVPDSGWVTQLEVDANSVQLTGYAAAANALIPALEGSPILGNAAFRSPVTQDAVRGVEQFHLSVDLRRRNE